MHDEQPSATITLPKPPKVIIFDLDGVILDSADIKLQGYKTIYANEDPRKLAALVEHCVLHGGVTRRTKFALYEREFFGRSGDHESVEALCRRYSDLVLQAVLGCPFIDGAERLLHRARGKVRMHLVSATPDNELQDVVRERGLAPFFRTVRGAPATKQDSFDRIVKEEECALVEALAIGDSMTEFLAAQNVGIPFLGIVARGIANPFPAAVPVWPTLQNAEKRLRIE
jgi:phosphoglycolate phosphatase-like HAD superfamily hydrolase